MRLEHLTPAHVRRALDIYLAAAWPRGTGATPALSLDELRGQSELEGLFARFEKVEGGGGGLKRYALRLGNDRYPFMKFVVQEHLVNGEYFFSVDTHDQLDIRPDNPEYAEWTRLKTFNRRLKLDIEEQWDRAGLPTHADLRVLMEELARFEREEKKRKSILLVDDEADVAQGLAALLRARGYEVELARDGLEALARLEQDPLPDLVLLDYEMPQLDGEEVLARLRRDPRTLNLLVLLATASTIDLSRLRKVSGLLRKPYPRHVLFAMIARLLEAPRAEALP
ncbi:MAG: response regulator [Planctomycetes bacterium]|nr:response regulator [Planctomycetota bacterium]